MRVIRSGSGGSKSSNLFIQQWRRELRLSKIDIIVLQMKKVSCLLPNKIKWFIIKIEKVKKRQAEQRRQPIRAHPQLSADPSIRFYR
jgi:hypothetical protein